MSNDTQSRWDQRYRDATVPSPAVRVLAENQHLLPTRGTALDLACGLGGNAVILAEHGLTTHAWDISPVAIEKINAYARARNLSIIAEAHDVMKNPLQPDSFDVIVVTHFLERCLIQPLINALRPQGLLFYQTFTRTRLGTAGPDKDEWRLADNELLTLFGALRPLVYREEGLIGDLGQGLRDEAMIVAQKK